MIRDSIRWLRWRLFGGRYVLVHDHQGVISIRRAYRHGARWECREYKRGSYVVLRDNGGTRYGAAMVAWEPYYPFRSERPIVPFPKYFPEE